MSLVFELVVEFVVAVLKPGFWRRGRLLGTLIAGSVLALLWLLYRNAVQAGI